MDVSTQIVMSQATCSELYRTYCRFKTNLIFETFLLSLINFKYRKAFIQFRLRSNNLYVVKGTYLNEQICKFCQLQQVEDEYHFFYFIVLFTLNSV